MDEDNEVPRSTAVVVECSDLENIMTESDQEDATVEELKPLAMEPAGGGEDSEDEEDGEDEDDENNSSDDVENNKRIRAATSQYLEGAYTLADLTAALETAGELEEGEGGGEIVDKVSESLEKDKAGQSSPVDAVEESEEPPEKKRKSDDDSASGTIATTTTTSTFGFNTSMLPPESQWEVRPKYTADFYSTGDKVSNFTLRRRRKMSPTVQGMMGEAHLRYVRGEKKSAIEICQEIIKEQPTITDPYALLSLIYADMNENDRALRFGMIGACLDPKHCKEWPRLAEMSLEQGNLQQAISCYTQSLSVTPDNPQLYFRRCELMKRAGDVKGAIKGYHRLIQAIPQDGKSCVQAYRRIAQLYYTEKTKEKAYETLLSAFKDYPAFVSPIEVNLILELMKHFKKYVESIHLVQKHANVVFTPPLLDKDFGDRNVLSSALAERTQVQTPDSFPIELCVKVITSLIHLEAYDLAKMLLPQVLAKPVEKFGDLYLEVAEAYMAKEKWTSSLELTSIIVKSPKMNEASLCFLRHAETLYSLGKYEQAAKAYETVISLVPNHHVAKLNYALILQKLGRSEDALLTLSQDQEEKIIDHYLIAEKCKIYIAQKRPVDLLDSALFLLTRHCHNLRSKEDTQAVAMTSHSDKRYEAVQLNRTKRDEHPDDKKASFVEQPEILNAEWNIYLHAAQVCMDMERYDLLERFTYTAWSSELFGQDAKMEKACGYQSYLASLLNVDQELLAPHVKAQSLSPEGVQNTMTLNLLAKALQRHDYVRYGRYLLRLVRKKPTDINLKLLTAHHNFSCGNYKTALIQYFYIYAKTPENPLVCLMIASSLLSVLSQKTSTNRPHLAVQVVAFLQHYMERRGKCQETYYNVGRMLHLIGAYEDAVRFYERALETQPVVKTHDGKPLCSEQKKHFFKEENFLDLKRDILYNLAQLYSSVGSVAKARYYIQQIRV